MLSGYVKLVEYSISYIKKKLFFEGKNFLYQIKNKNFAEEVILAEERTTEEERMHIMEG